MDALPERGFTLGHAERLRIRASGFTGPTSGLAPGNVQANLVILPSGAILRISWSPVSAM